MSQKFTVTFYDDDRKTVLDKQEVNKGESAKYAGKTPEKSAINGIEYTFVGWEMSGNIEFVTENIELFAKYEESSKSNSRESNDLFSLSEANAENARLDEVMQAGQKVSQAEKATRNMTLEEKTALVNEVKDKGSVDLDKQNENERD